MAEVFPFRALHYNPHKVAPLAQAVTQPYDKITPQMQERYYAASPHNLVRVIRGLTHSGDGESANVYTRARDHFKGWIESGILVADAAASFYPYHQEYSLPGGKDGRITRRGFIALLRLEDYANRVVHRHEETLSGPKADRLNLLRLTRAHFGQIFMLYSDPQGEVEAALAGHSQGSAWQQAEDEHGTRHSVWRISEAAAISRISEAMRRKKLVIADGHHRYETALAYRNERRAGGADDRAEYVMATFVRMETPGLTILPTHRVLHGLRGFDWHAFRTQALEWFDWQEAALPAADVSGEMVRLVAQAGGRGTALGAYAGNGRAAVLTMRSPAALAAALPEIPDALRALDVVALHRLLLERAMKIDPQAVREERHLHYVREAPEAMGAVDQGQADLCFILNPTPIEALRNTAFDGLVMPQKSTDFYPKLLSGLTIYWLDNPGGM